MAAMLQRDEWKAFSDFLALAAAGLFVVVGLIPVSYTHLTLPTILLV